MAERCRKYPRVGEGRGRRETKRGRKEPKAARRREPRAAGRKEPKRDGKSRRRRAERDEAGTERAEAKPSGGGNTRALPRRAEEEAGRAEHLRTAPKRGRGEPRAAPKRGRGDPSVSERRRRRSGNTRSEAGAMAAAGAEPPCGLCGAAAAPYTCPRCNRRLCSLRCYRGHGGCAEAFYREQVLQTLRAERGSPPGRPRLAAACTRLRQLREAEASAGRAGRGLWETLSPAERAAFQRLLRTGEAAKLLPPWRPWWWRRDKDKDEDGDEDEPPAAPAPAVPSAIPPLSSFPAPPPSPLLRFQLPNVLFGYVFALSLHGGDESLLPELPAAAIDASAALRTRRAFGSTAQALRAARDDVAASGYPTCPLGDAGAVLAVAELLEGRGDNRDNTDDNGNADNDNDDTDSDNGDTDSDNGDTGNNYVVAALAHLERLLRRGRRGLEPEERRRFGAARRKCRFLLSWSREATPGTMEELARDTRMVHRELVSANESGTGPRELGSANERRTGRPELDGADEGRMGPWELVSANERRGRRLIEELD